jgi:uncharacterized protein YjlB
MNQQKYFIEYSYEVNDDGTFPNSHLPVVLYKDVLDLPAIFPAHYVETVFKDNGWTNSWKSGIFTYHHYHSITHEVLGVFKGESMIQIGGENGTKIKLEKGDVLIIPAGVAHKNLQEEDDLACVGAYPDGRDNDMNYGKSGERPLTDQNIKQVPLPHRDPVLGLKGGINNYWRKVRGR